MIEEDDRKPAKPGPAAGEDLANLSVEELEARVELFEAEIARLKQAIASKQSSKSAADSFFKL
jgi:uncharacterized small protein (DUF1192 family)